MRSEELQTQVIFGNEALPLKTIFTTPMQQEVYHRKLHIFFIFSQLLYSPLNVGSFFSFLILYTDGRTPWTIDQPASRPLLTHRTTQTQNKRTQTSMPRVRFEATIPVFERAKKVNALDCAATVLGGNDVYGVQILTFSNQNCCARTVGWTVLRRGLQMQPGIVDSNCIVVTESQFWTRLYVYRSRESAIGIMTGYGLYG
jgi:hypothetical protein